jgi:hypothetical protein
MRRILSHEQHVKLQALFEKREREKNGRGKNRGER